MNQLVERLKELNRQHPDADVMPFREAATAITDLEALVGELGEVLEAITAMQALAAVENP